MINDPREEAELKRLQHVRSNADGDPLGGFLDGVAREMSIARGRFDPAVTKEPADDRETFAERQRPRSKAVPDVMDAHIVEPGMCADSGPGAVDVGHVRARLESRNDPEIAGLVRQDV